MAVWEGGGGGGLGVVSTEKIIVNIEWFKVMDKLRW